jgi:hypothetical protein
MFKIITSRDIDYQDGKIQNINGIEFDIGKIILKKKIHSSSGTSESLSGINNLINSHEIKFMSENWNKFLKTLRSTVKM